MMETRNRLASKSLRWLAGATLAWWSLAAPAQQAAAPSQVPTDVAELAATFNDEVIPFNDQLIVLGKPDAKVTAVLLFGLSGDTGYFMERVFPSLKEKYVDSGRIRLIIYDFPLTWHDMQALAGFRCLPADKHLEVLQAAVRHNTFAQGMKRASYLNTPDYVWGILKSFDIPRDKAEQCMRNNAIVGHVEALRRTATQSWWVTWAPSFIVGNRVLHNPSSLGQIEAVLNSALKEGK